MINFGYRLLNYTRRKLERGLGFATVGVKVLLVNEQQEVLLIKHTYVEGWHLPGGGMHFNETPKTAASREVAEETYINVAPEDLALFAVYTHSPFGGSDYPILYVATKFQIMSAFKPSREIKEMGWFGMHQLPFDITPPTQQCLLEYFQARVSRERW